MRYLNEKCFDVGIGRILQTNKPEERTVKTKTDFISSHLSSR